MPEWLSKVSGRIKDAMKRGKPLAESLPQMLDAGDPRVAMRPLGADWLCPFTGVRVVAPDWDGSSLTVLKSQSIMSHLLAQPELQKLGSNAQMKSWDDLVQICLFMRFEHGGVYKVTTKEGEWVCPYCLENTGVILTNWDGSEAPLKMFLPDAFKHLKSCPEYQQDNLGAKTMQQIRDSGGERAKLTKALHRDPRFRLTDAAGNWFCPFSARPIPSLNIKKEAWGPQLQTKIVDYMLGPDCPAKYSQYVVERSMEDLQAALASVGKVKPI